MTIHATFENGVFTPKEPVDLPDGAEVNFDLEVIQSDPALSPAMAKAYEILSRRYDGVAPDLGDPRLPHQNSV